MNALVPMTDRELRLSMARDRLRRPEEHAAHELRAACATMRSDGDWIDAEKAKALLARLDQEEHWLQVGIREPVDVLDDEEVPLPVHEAEFARLCEEADRRRDEVYELLPAPSLARDLAKDLFDLVVILALIFGALFLAYGFGVMS